MGQVDKARELATIVGLSFFFMMLRPPYLGTIVDFGTAASFQARIFVEIAAVCLACIFLAAAGRFERSKWLRVGLPPTCCALLLACVPLARSSSLACVFAGTGLLGCGLTLLCLGWAIVCSERDIREVLVLSFSAFVLSMAAGLVELLPNMAFRWMVIIAPVLSCALLSSALVSWGKTTGAVRERGRRGGLLGPSWLRVCLVAFLATEILSCALVRSIWGHGGVGYRGLGLGGQWSYITSALLGTMVLVALLRFRGRRYLPFSLCLASFALLIVGICSLLGNGIHANASLLTTLHTLLLVALFAVLAGGGGSTWAPARSAGVFVVLRSAGNLLTFIVAPAMLSSGQASQPMLSVSICSASFAVLAVGVCSCLFLCFAMVSGRRERGGAAGGGGLVPEATTRGAGDFSAPDPEPESPGGPGDGTGERRSALDVLAEEASLSRRECDVVGLMARGYSIKRIADELGIKYGTVQGYTKSIYRKLDVHSRDEVAALVAAQEASGKSIRRKSNHVTSP